MTGCQEVTGEQAKDGVKLLDSWGEFRRRKTGILLPLHVKYLTEADGYWITLLHMLRLSGQKHSRNTFQGYFEHTICRG